MKEILDLAVSVLSAVDSIHSTHVEYTGMKQSLATTISMLTNFVAVNASREEDVLNSKNQKMLIESLNRIREEIELLFPADAPSPGCVRAFFRGFGGSFCGVKKDLTTLRNFEGDLNQIVNFLRLEITAKNNEILARYTGLYNAESETPRQHWYRMFKDSADVSTDEFCKTLRSISKCDGKALSYIAATMSTNGKVTSDGFVGKFSDPKEPVNIFDWLREAVLRSEARTVNIPGHVQAITEMKLVGCNSIATASVDCTIKIFDIYGPTLILKLVLTGHEKPVRSFAFCEKTKKIVSVSEDKTVRVWNAVTGDQQSVASMEDVATHVVEVKSEASVVVYACSEAVYQVTFYDYLEKVVINIIRISVSVIRYLDCTSEGRVVLCDSDTIYTMDSKGESIASVNKSGNCCAVRGETVMCSTNKGIAIFDARTLAGVDTVDIIDADNDHFNVRKIRVYGDKIYVVWTLGRFKTGVTVSTVCLISGAKCDYQSNHIFSCSRCVVHGDTIYVAKGDNNVCWYKLCDDALHAVGSTANDQMVLGACVSGVKIIVTGCDNLLSVNKNQLNSYNYNNPESCTKLTFPFAILDCVAVGDENVMIDGSSVYWYDKLYPLRLLHSVNTAWTLRKLSVAGKHAILLYGDDSDDWGMDATIRRSFSRTLISSQLAVLKGHDVEKLSLKANRVLMTICDAVFLARDECIVVIGASSQEYRFAIANPAFVDGSPMSSCAISSEAFCVLYSCHTVVTWALCACDATHVSHRRVDASITDIYEYDGHIVALSTIGTVFVFDYNVGFVRCVVTHQAKKIFGAPYGSDFVVSDRDGVARIITGLVSKSPKQRKFPRKSFTVSDLRYMV